MGRNRFVQPESVRLSLSDGDWIEIKKRLNTGEVQAMYAQMRSSEERPGIDPGKVGIARVLAYLLDWSLTQHGKPVVVEASALRGLDPDDFAEIRDAIDAHVAATEAALDAAKKLRAGETPSSAISACVA